MASEEHATESNAFEGGGGAVVAVRDQAESPDTGNEGWVRRWAPVGVVVVASLAVYANALANGLQFDDQYQIVTNPWIRSWRNLPAIFSSGVLDLDGRASGAYRPMMYALYTLVHAVAGAAPWAYHLLSIVLHAGTSALAMLVARALLGSVDARQPWWQSPSFLVGLLFAVHPLHAEAVAWAGGLADVAYAFFYLLALLLVIRPDGRPRDTVMALGAYAAALLSKEPAVTLPAVVLLYWWMKEGRRPGLTGLAARMAPWLAVTAAYLVVRGVVLGGLAPGTSPADLSPVEYGLTAAWVALMVWSIRRRALVPCLALALAVLPMTPHLLLRSPNDGLENAFAERYVYASSFGVLLFAGWAVAALDTARPRIARVLSLGLAAVAMIAAVATVQRNAAWDGPLSLWRDAARKSPGSAVANLNYGFALIDAGKTEEGARHVARAVQLSPDLVQSRMGRAVNYARLRRSEDALVAFQRVLAMAPNSSEAHYNLAVLHEERGETERAIREYEAAIALDPNAANAHNNVGILHFVAGNRELGTKHLEEAVRLRPGDSRFRTNLGKARGQ